MERTLELKINRVLFILMLISLGQGYAQKLNIGVGFQYQYSTEYVKAMDQFNFTHPGLVKEQNPLSNGLYLDMDYIFKGEKLVKHGIYANYLFYRSTGLADNYENVVQQHGLNIGYLLRLDGLKMKWFFVDFGAAAAMNFLERKLNGDWLTYGDGNKVGFGMGWNFDFRFGYRQVLGTQNKIRIVPFLGLGFGRLFSPNAEEVILQSSAQTIKDCSWMITGRLGFLVEVNFD